MLNPAEQSALDQQFMRRALEVAQQGRYWCSPNPHVGCVIVRDGQELATGFTQPPGGAHAEIDALSKLGSCPSATAYVTLEPCSHWGRTGPCADALVAAGVKRVVAALEDPHPAVSGEGFRRLRAAGVHVDVGLMADEARAEILGFLLRIERGWGRVRLKVGMSLDGRTAMASGESQWITSDESRRDVQRLRAMSSFIVTSVATVLADNCALTVRASELDLDDEVKARALVRAPTRVVLDTRGRLPSDANILSGDAETLVLHGPAVTMPAVIQGEACPLRGAHLDLRSVLAQLGERGGNDIMIEAGPTLAAGFLERNLVDELVIYLAPKLLGSSARPMAHLALERLGESLNMDYRDVRLLGADLRIIAVPQQGATNN